jgi:dipeptidyl aminopeptidase/acylaminoacyl peptidase
MTPPLIPLSLLFGATSALAPAMSPSGRLLAYLAPGAEGQDAEGTLNIWVAPADAPIRCGSAAGRGMPRARAVTHHPHGIHEFGWAGDDRYLMYAIDQNGDERTHVRLLDLTLGTDRDLTPYPGVTASVVASDPRIPGAVLLGMDRRIPGRRDVYRLDPATSETTLAAENNGVIRWLADTALAVRGAVTRLPDGSAQLLIRDAEDGPWRVVYQVGYADALEFRPLGFTADGRRVIAASSDGANAARLLRIDTATGTAEVIYESPDGYDVTGADIDPGTGEPRIAVVRRQRLDLEVLDPALAPEIAWLRERCRGDVCLLDRDSGDRWWLIQDLADDAPAAYLLFDRRARQLRYLYSHWPELARYQLAKVEPFVISSRDGLTLRGYLTYPPGLERRNLPTVLAVHGGPWTRDVWGLRAESQWLANRGYLCVCVNFRGSTGYGKDFLNAGDHEWGGRMQDDLLDTVGYLVDRQIADPSRLAIMGHSYGGYAALCAAAFTPERFRCVIASSAPADLRTFLGAIGGARGAAAAEMYRRVGHPVTDAELLWSRSPLRLASQIRSPVLIAQGANDPRVPRAQAEQIVAVLRDHGLPHEYLLFDDEGHGLNHPRNTMAFYAAAERFLGAHLGGRVEMRAGTPACIANAP